MTRSRIPRRWVVVGGVWALSVAINAYIMAPASVLQVLMEGLSIGPANAGWIISVALGAQIVASIPVGIGLDRRDNRRIILAGAGLFAAASVWGWYAGAAASFVSLLASRFVGGLALTVVWNAGTNLVSHIVPAGRQATAVGLYASSAPAGFALGQVSGPAVSGALGWPAVFAVFGAFGAAAAGVFWVASRDIEATVTGLDTPEFGDFAHVLTSKPVWHIGVLAFLSFSIYVFMNSWMPTYLVTERGLSLAASGVLVALFSGVGILSRAGSGALSDVAFDSRRRPVVVISLVAAVPAILAIPLTGVLPAVIGLLILSGLFLQICLSLYFAYVQDLVERNVTGTAIAFVTTIGVTGAVSSPIVAGTLIERTGDFLTSFAYVGALGAAGIVLAWRAPTLDER